MRNVKVVLAAMAALALWGRVQPTPSRSSKKINAPALPPKVWAIAGDFCAIKDWHPLVADCKETEEGHHLPHPHAQERRHHQRRSCSSPTIPATATRSSKARCR